MKIKAPLAEMQALLPLPATEKWPLGVWDAPALQHGTLSVLYFAPRGEDFQTAHEQDELYIVLQGTATLRHGDTETHCALGDVLFVPAGVPHRFETFSDNFATWAIFYGPTGGERANPLGTP